MVASHEAPSAALPAMSQDAKNFPFVIMPLSTDLQQQLREGFFRPLARPSWPVSVDIAERLLEGADEGGQLSREDALGLIREVLAQHPRAALDADEGAAFSDARQRAPQLYNRLLDAGWLQERPVALGEYWVLVTPALRMLVRLLLDLARSDLGELKDFSASLRSICETLLMPEALNPARLDAEALRQTVKDLVDRTTRAGDQMHAVESLILREETLQRQSGDAAETLNRFLVDFHAGEHMVCYDALQENGLIPRLHQARRVVQEAASSALAKDRLAAGIALHTKGSTADPYAEAEGMFQKLGRGLAAIPAKQQIIDGRMADFSRLSAQRYRYQTEMRGKKPEQVKAYLDAAADEYEGKRFSDLDREPGMIFLCPHAGIYFGSASLATVRRMRQPVNLSLEKPEGGNASAEAKEIIRKHNLLVVTPQRAARFIRQRLEKKGTTLSTAGLSWLPEDDFLDFLAVLAFDRAPSQGTSRTVRWKIHADRRDHGLEPDHIPQDTINGWQVDRVIIERVS